MKWEEYTTDKKADYIFAINCIYHCEDINAFVAKLYELSG